MAKVRKKQVRKMDLLFSTILLKDDFLQTNPNQYIIKNGIEHLFRCNQASHVKDLLLQLPYFTLLLKEWDSFIAPLRFWRAVGLQYAREGYPEILKSLGLPTAHNQEEAKHVFLAAYFFRKAGLYRLAISYMEWGVSVQEAEEGEEIDVLLSKLIISDLHRKNKNLSQAEAILLAVIPLFTKRLDPTHEHVNLGKYYLANVYQDKEEYKKAAPLFQMVLDFQKKTFGEYHTSTLNTMNDLAMLYKEQERYIEAEMLYLKTLQIRQEVLGENHPSTVDTLHNIAVLYRSLDRYEEAEALFLDIVQIDAYNLGEEHPDSLISVSILARFYMDTERYEEAEPLLKKIINIRKKNLGGSHEDTLNEIAALADFYQKQDRLDRSVVCYAEIAMALREREGPTHIETQKAIFDWALCRIDVGEREEGIVQLQELLSLREKTFGQMHEETLKVSNELSHLYIEDERYEEAIVFFQRDLLYQMEQNNEEERCWCHYNIAECFRRMEQYSHAEPHFQQSIQSASRCYGETDTELVSLYGSLAHCLEKQDLYLRASKCRAESFKIQVQFTAIDQEETQDILLAWVHVLILAEQPMQSYETVYPHMATLLNIDPDLLFSWEEVMVLLAVKLKEQETYAEVISIHHFISRIQSLIRPAEDIQIAINQNNLAWILLLDTPQIPTIIFASLLKKCAERDDWFLTWLELGYELSLCKAEECNQVESVIAKLKEQLGEDHPRVERAKNYGSRF